MMNKRDVIDFMSLIVAPTITLFQWEFRIATKNVIAS